MWLSSRLIVFLEKFAQANNFLEATDRKIVNTEVKIRWTQKLLKSRPEKHRNAAVTVKHTPQCRAENVVANIERRNDRKLEFGIDTKTEHRFNGE